MKNPFKKPDPALQMSEAQMKAIDVQVKSMLFALPVHRKQKLVDAMKNDGAELELRLRFHTEGDPSTQVWLMVGDDGYLLTDGGDLGI